MPERLYQSRFNEHCQPEPFQDVTPEGFAGLEFDKGREAELSRFVREVSAEVQIISPADAAEYLMKEVFSPFEDFDQEEMWTLLLDSKNNVTHEVMVYRGTVNTVYIREAELLKEAVRINAPALILSHVHPSGSPLPSPEDVNITRLTEEAAKLLDLTLLDHIIVGKDAWVSLKERGLGFE